MRIFLVLLAVLGASASPLVFPRASQCDAGVRIFSARGTLEIGPGLQFVIHDAILNKIANSSVYNIEYPSNFEFTNGVAAGVNTTKSALEAYYCTCPDGKIVLMGYSQGAEVIGNTLAGGGSLDPNHVPTVASPPISHDLTANVIAIVLFGDINYNHLQGTNNYPKTPCTLDSQLPRNGSVAANMQYYSPRLDEYCASTDSLCCSNATTALGHLSYFSGENAAAIADYIADRYKE